MDHSKKGIVIEFMIDVSTRQGYERGVFVKKIKRNEHRQEMEIVYDSRSKEYMIKICFIKLGIQDLFKYVLWWNKRYNIPP